MASLCDSSEGQRLEFNSIDAKEGLGMRVFATTQVGGGHALKTPLG